MRRLWTRRGAASALGGAAVFPSAALAQQPEAPPADGGAFLETAFDQAARFVVPVAVDSLGPFEFVIDTGANRSVVSQNVAQACGLPAAGSAPVHGIVSVEMAPLVKVRKLRVGEVVSFNMELPVVARAKIGADGLLGLDAMKGRRITLGFRDQTFRVAASARGATVAPGRDTRIGAAYEPVSVPARYRSGQLVIIDAEAAGQHVLAFLDSGSQVTVANKVVRDRVMRLRPDLAMGAVPQDLISATGQRAPAEFAPLPGLRLGGLRIADPLVAYADLHIFNLWGLQNEPAILVGVDVLRRFDQVAFDFGRKVIVFWPPKPRRAG
jgi:hypothetical protein